MATAGSIVIDLLARTGSFETDMNRARKKVGEMETDLRGMITRLDRAAIAIAGVAAGAAAGMVALTMQTVKTMDATSKMADQIGVTTEALTGLRFAAQQFANVSDQTFDMALRRMTRRIEEAAQGSGGAKAAFEAMGLSAKELARLSADQQFMRIADAMQKTDTQAQRLKNTMAIFDTEGMPLVNALSQGSEELEKNIELATKYGVVLSTQAARSAEQLTDNLSRLSSIQDGWRQQLTTAMLPALERMSGYILSVAESSIEVGNSRGRMEAFGEAAVAMVDDMARAYAGLVEMGSGVIDLFEELDRRATVWVEPFKRETQAAASILSQSFSESILNTAREIDKLVGFAGGVMGAWEAAVHNIEQYFRSAWNTVLIETESFVNQLIDKVNPMLARLGMEGFDPIKLSDDNFVAFFYDITQAYNEGRDAAKAYVDMTGRVQSAMDSLKASTAATAKELNGGGGGGGGGVSKALSDAQKAAQAFRKEQDRALVAQLQSVSAIHAQAQGIEDQVALFGQSKTALEDLTIARLEEQAAILRGFPGSAEQVEIIEAEIEARKRLRTAMGSLEQKEAERASWQAWAQDVKQVFDQVGQSLTDAIFDGGKSGKELLKDVFKGLTFNVLINPVMQAGQQWVTQQLGGMFGYQSPSQQQQAGGFGFGGGAFGAGGVQMAGDWLLRSGLAPETGANMLMNADSIATSAGNILGYGNAIWDLTEGRYGSAVGTAIGQFAGGPIGAAVGSMLGGVVDGLFDREPTTRRGQRARVDYSDGAYGITSTDDRQAGAEATIRQITQQAVESANAIFSQIGIDAAIDSLYAITESSIKGDRQGVASGGQLRIGDQLRQIGIGQSSDMTLAGFGGWSSEDMLTRLATDVQLSIIEAFQQADIMSTLLGGIDVRSLDAGAAQELVATVQRVVQEVGALQQVIELLPFANLRDLSFDAAQGLIAAAGGLENLNTGMSSYIQNFYSEQEQLDILAGQLGAAFEGIGYAMPDVTQGADAARAAFRALFDSLDVTTEAGAQAAATMLAVNGQFSELVTGLDALNGSVSDILREREGLERTLLQLQGDTAELRRRELAALDESNHALQLRIWSLQDEADAATAARNEHDRLVRVSDAQMQDAIGQLNAAWAAVQRYAQQEISRLQQTFSATDSVFRAYQTQVRSLESELGGLLTTIGRGVADLRAVASTSPRMQYDQARAVISTALVTGQLPQTADLTEAMRIAQQGVAGARYASAFDQRAAYLTLANELEALQDIAKPELDTARASLEQLERQYNQLRGIANIGDLSLSELQKQVSVALQAEASARIQIAGIENQLNWAERQYNALMGIDGSITSLATAMQAFGAAAAAVREAQANPVSRDERYYEAKLAQLRRTGDTYGGIDWTTASTSDLAAFFRLEGLTPEEHWKRWGKAEGLSYDVGTSYVPYDMMANVHRGEIIIDPRSSDILRRYGIGVQGGGSSRETEQLLREQLAETRQQNRYLYEIVKSGKRTANHTETVERAVMDDDGALLLTY